MNKSDYIRNFSIIAHIDHGKSTLADRMLEVTGTIAKREMKEQFLDSMDLERERGITIKMTPVRMHWRHLDRRINADSTQKDAEGDDFLYGELTYKIRGVLFTVRKHLGLGHKEQVYHRAVEIEMAKAGLQYVSKSNIPLRYDGKVIGTYQPDFVVENRVLVELKALPEIGKPQIEQIWSYLKGCEYKLALLANFGSRDLDVKRMVYDSARSASAVSASGLRESAGVVNQVEYILNLIDTPGHVDFAYEVSRAMSAVEGAILLVDATQGIEAQTLSVLEIARSVGIVIVPALSKVDAPAARVLEVRKEVAELLHCNEEDILLTSGKTGEGVPELLNAVVARIPPPRGREDGTLKALVFDFHYSDHRGIIVYTRVFDGVIRAKDGLTFMAAGKTFSANEVGILTPKELSTGEIRSGEIGYITTGIKEPGIASVGDTIAAKGARGEPMAGYRTPQPVIWASVYPEEEAQVRSGDSFETLRQALERLSLSDSSLSWEEERSGVLGRGFRCGFLGMLHLEIITERLRREFNLSLIVTTPSVAYTIEHPGGRREKVYTPSKFPVHGANVVVYEPWVSLTILTPGTHMGPLIQLLALHEAFVKNTQNVSGNRIRLSAEMPLRELMRNFFDKATSATSGYVSISYEHIDERPADVARIDILVAEEAVPALARVVAVRRLDEEARTLVEKIHATLPAQQFMTKIQALARGRIIAAERLAARRKDVTGYLYGGDVTRKMKLLEKQKRGKKKMQAMGKVRIPNEVFIKLLKD